MNIRELIRRMCIVLLICISIVFVLTFIITGRSQELMTLIILSILVGGIAFLIERTFSWIIAGLRAPKIGHKE